LRDLKLGGVAGRSDFKQGGLLVLQVELTNFYLGLRQNTGNLLRPSDTVRRDFELFGSLGMALEIVVRPLERKASTRPQPSSRASFPSANLRTMTGVA
jgi:hypothetical protein